LCSQMFDKSFAHTVTLYPDVRGHLVLPKFTSCRTRKEKKGLVLILFKEWKCPLQSHFFTIRIEELRLHAGHLGISRDSSLISRPARQPEDQCLHFQSNHSKIAIKARQHSRDTHYLLNRTNPTGQRAPKMCKTPGRITKAAMKLPIISNDRVIDIIL